MGSEQRGAVHRGCKSARQVINRLRQGINQLGWGEGDLGTWSETVSLAEFSIRACKYMCEGQARGVSTVRARTLAGTVRSGFVSQCWGGWGDLQ